MAAQKGGATASHRAARRREIDEQVATMPPVRLRPVLSVAPGTYLTVGLGLLVLLVLFLVLIAPGLAFDGTILRVTSTPSDAAVHLDGRFAATTPADLRVPRGAHTLRLSRPSFRTAEVSIDAGGRIFGSLLVPRREKRHFAIELEDPQGLLDQAIADFAASPLLATSIASAAAALATRDTVDASRFVHLFIQHATQDSVSHAVEATVLLLGGSAPTSPGGIARFVSFLAQHNTRHGAALLARASPLPVRPQVVQSDWFRAWREREEARLHAWLRQHDTAPPDGRRSLSVGSLTFDEIPAGRFVMGDTRRIQDLASRTSPVEEMPHIVEVPRFYAGTREVSKREFAAFVAANPGWAPANRAALVEEGLASPDYLGDWGDSGPRAETLDHPVTYVSFYAAEAYAAWLSEHPAVRGAGLIARLPYEPEWERAARGGLPDSRYPTGSEAPTARVSTPRDGPAAVGFSAPNGYGLQDTIGNVWEWTGDWYAPNTYYLRSNWERDYGPGRRLRVGAERVVRGGSFVDELASVTVHTRGAQPPDWCTPVLGFRLVLAER